MFTDQQSLASLDIFQKSEVGTNKMQLADIDCPVGTDHKHYIAYSKFTKSDLPKTYQEKVMETLVYSVANLTVVIEVLVEDQDSNTDNMKEAKPTYWQGTGKIDDVFIPKIRKRLCRCVKCKISETPSQEWGEVRIVTNVNLLKGNKDADKCTLFFNDIETSSSELKYIYGDRRLKYGDNNELCKFMCVTCDMEVIDKLDKMVDTFVDSWKSAFDKYTDTVKSEEERLVVLVSHPHGCCKQVSIGKWIKKDEESNKTKLRERIEMKGRMKYLAPTCPGCSGAYILIPKFDVVHDIFK